MRLVGRVSHPRVAVTATAVTGLLSLVTGVLHIAGRVPLAIVHPTIPDVVIDAAGFTGAMTGFLLLFFAWLLYQRLWIGWIGALILLPLATAQGLIQANVFSLPLVVLSSVSLPVVALNRRSFRRTISMDIAQIAAAVTVLGAFAYGTVGTYALRDEFIGVSTLLDAFYYTVITATTVGYGDTAAQTQFARLFSITVVVFATASFAVVLGTLLAPALERRVSSALGRMTESELASLTDHLVVIGVGSLTEPMLTELPGEMEHVIIEDDEDLVARLRNRGYRVLEGSGSDDATLRRAQLTQARAAIIATEDDATDVLAILTVRDIAPDLRIIGAANNAENVAKMRNAGATTVISPATIGGKLMAASALREHDSDTSAVSPIDEEVSDDIDTLLGSDGGQ